MNKIRLLLLITLTGLTAVVLSRIFIFIVSLRLSHKYVWNHYPGTCELVQGVEIGSEDLELLPNGLVLMSTGLQLQPDAMPSRTGKSTILMLDLNQPGKPVATEAEIEWGKDRPQAGFIIHGLSSWKIDDQNTIVFAVSHEKSGEGIMRFNMNMKTRILHYLETIQDDHFFNVNDVAATGERTFYFTNDAYYQHSVLKLLEVLLALPLGSVGYYNGQSGKLVDRNMHVPNGILISADQRSVFVAVTSEQRIIQYSRNSQNDIERQKVVDLHTHPDNLFWDQNTGQLLVGCHPIPWMIFSHMMNPDTTTQAPAKVLAVETEEGHMTDKMIELLSTMGQDIAGASTAVIYKNRLLVGTVMQKALVCEMVYPNMDPTANKT